MTLNSGKLGGVNPLYAPVLTGKPIPQERVDITQQRTADPCNVQSQTKIENNAKSHQTLSQLKMAPLNIKDFSRDIRDFSRFKHEFNSLVKPLCSPNQLSLALKNKLTEDHIQDIRIKYKEELRKEINNMKLQIEEMEENYDWTFNFLHPFPRL